MPPRQRGVQSSVGPPYLASYLFPRKRWEWVTFGRAALTMEWLTRCPSGRANLTTDFADLRAISTERLYRAFQGIPVPFRICSACPCENGHFSQQALTYDAPIDVRSGNGVANLNCANTCALMSSSFHVSASMNVSPP